MTGAEDPERDVPVPARERDRVPHLRGRLRAEHEGGRPAAQVAGGVPDVPGVTGLDRVRGQRRRDRVVVDPGAAFGQRDRVPDPARGLGATARPRPLDLLPHGGRDLRREVPQPVRVIPHHDEGADAVGQRQPRQVLGALLGGDVQQPGDLPRVAARGGRRLVDRDVAALQVAGLQVGQRRQPAVRLAAGQRQHPRFVRADPDRDVVGRRGTALGPVDPVVVAAGVQRPPLGGVPDPADHVDRLIQRRHRLGRRHRRPPMAAIASQNPPAPMPRLTRPPDSRSRLAAARASTAG